MDIKVKEKINLINKTLSDLEVSELTLLSAIYNNRLNAYVNENLEKITNEFKYMCELYGKSFDDNRNTYDEIIKKYNENFDIIINAYNIQYDNVLNELMSTLGNEKIAVSNFVTSVEMKENLLNSDEYKLYVLNMKELEKRREEAQTKAEFDEIDEKIRDNVNPILVLDKKIDAVIQKYEDYLALERIIKELLEEISNNAINDLPIVMNQVNTSVMIQDSGIKLAINKIINKLFGKKKFDSLYVAKRLESLDSAKQGLVKKAEEIREKSIEVIAQALDYKTVVQNRYHDKIA